MFQLKSILYGSLTTLGVLAGLNASAIAATESTPQTTGPSHRMHHAHFGDKQGTGQFMRAVHQLDLSDDQKQRMHSLVATNRDQARASFSTQRANRETLANPGDPNYAAAVQAAKTAAATAIQDRSDLQVQIYGLLTTDQQAQLPKVLADMKTRGEERRMDWQQRHGTQSSGSNL